MKRTTTMLVAGLLLLALSAGTAFAATFTGIAGGDVLKGTAKASIRRRMGPGSA